VLAPILPARLADMHCPPLLQGAIFGAYPLTVALASLAVPFASARLGRLPVLLGGIVAEGVFVIVFGFVPSLVRAERPCLYVLLLLRIAQGLGEAAQSTALLAYASEAFGPRRVLGAAMGFQETAAGVGFVIGPALGGLLADGAGFAAPFLLIGVAILSLTALLPSALAGVKSSAGDGTLAGATHAGPAPPWRAYCTFDFLNAGAATVLMGTAFGTIVPTLAPHLAQTLALRSTVRVGAAYIIPAAVYGCACPLMGDVADRTGYRRVMLYGFGGLAAAFVMMGPLPPLRALFALDAPGSARAWVWAIAAMAAFGVGGAAGFVPTLPAMERAAAPLGPHGTETVAGLYWTLYFLGEGVGPFIGSAAVRSMGPGWGYGAVAAMLGSFVWASAHFGAKAPPEEAGSSAAAASGGEGREMEDMGERGDEDGDVEREPLLAA
jgi:MFS family permease